MCISIRVYWKMPAQHDKLLRDNIGHEPRECLVCVQCNTKCVPSESSCRNRCEQKRRYSFDISIADDPLPRVEKPIRGQSQTAVEVATSAQWQPKHSAQ